MMKYRCAFGSERRTNRNERRLAKRDLSRGREPQRQYRTGKHWQD